MFRQSLAIVAAFVGCLTIALLGYSTLFAQTARPVILSEDECASLVGGDNGCPTEDCACAGQNCQPTGGTPPCLTTSATCEDDGAGGCIMLMQYSGRYCGAPDLNHPNGCIDFVASDNCAITLTGSPINYYGNWTCTYPTNPPICRIQGQVCGQPLYECNQN